MLFDVGLLEIEMKSIITLLVLFLLTPFSVLPGAEHDKEAKEVAKPSVINVKFVEKRGMKPPLRCFHVQLSIKNTHKHPVWYITRYWGDHPLAKDNSFKAINPWKRGYEIHNAYNGDRFGGKGKFRTTHFIGADPPGKDQHSFVAFRLPAGGVLKHDFFPIESWSDISSIEIWEASSLQVNGKRPLEEWLPYQVTSSVETHITKKAYWEVMHSGAFQWKDGMSTADYPKEQVTFIIPTVMIRHDLSIKGIEKKEKSNKADAGDGL